MKTTFTSLAFAAALALAATAQAQSWKGAANGTSHADAPAIAAAASGIGIAGSSSGTVANSAGQCTQGFSNQCLVGPCTCFTFAGTALVSRVGKGPSNIFMTLDFGQAIASGMGDCFPAYLEFDVTAAKDTETWSGIGSACDGADGNALPLSGGFALQTSTFYTAAITRFTISPNFSRMTFRMRHSGKADL